MKFGICSEIFKDWNDIGRAIAFAKETGYDGLEIAPFTLAQYVTDIPAQTRGDIVAKAREHDLEGRPRPYRAVYRRSGPFLRRYRRADHGFRLAETTQRHGGRDL